MQKSESIVKKISLIVVGAYGRLGSAIVEEALKDADVELKAIVVKKVDPKKDISNIKSVTDLSKVVGQGDVEIVESHHRNKKDAPSGTALALAAAISEVSHQKIGMHSLRGGDVVGEHRVHFLLDGDRIELAHIAGNRGIFAKGGIVTAKFI